MKLLIKCVLALGVVFVALGQAPEAQENSERKVTDYKKMAGLDLTQFTEKQQQPSSSGPTRKAAIAAAK